MARGWERAQPQFWERVKEEHERRNHARQDRHASRGKTSKRDSFCGYVFGSPNWNAYSSLSVCTESSGSESIEAIQYRYSYKEHPRLQDCMDDDIRF